MKTMIAVLVVFTLSAVQAVERNFMDRCVAFDGTGQLLPPGFRRKDPEGMQNPTGKRRITRRFLPFSSPASRAAVHSARIQTAMRAGPRFCQSA